LVVVLAGMAFQIRNWFGAWTILVTGAVVFAVTWWLPGTWHRGFAYFVSWFLLASGPREVLGLYAARRRRGARTSDADQLARLTHVPAGLWSAMFLLICTAAAGLGIWLLR
jgi:Peptidase M50B-like